MCASHSWWLARASSSSGASVANRSEVRPADVGVAHALVVPDQDVHRAGDVAGLGLVAGGGRLLGEQLGHGEDDALLGLEVVEHRLVGDAGRLGDAGQRDVLVGVLEEERGWPRGRCARGVAATASARAPMV